MSIQQIEISFQETGLLEDSMECLKVGTSSGHHRADLARRIETETRDYRKRQCEPKVLAPVHIHLLT